MSPPRIFVTALWLAATLLSAAPLATTRAAPPQPDRTPVYAVVDRTTASGCRIAFQDGPAPATLILPASAQPCAPGSVLETRTTTRAEARRLGLPFVVKTGNAARDTANVRALQQRLRPPPAQIHTTCSAGTRTATFQYGGRSVFVFTVQVNYRRNSDCSITNIVDRMSYTVSNNQRLPACWTRSATNGGRDPENRLLTMVHYNVYTAWHGGLANSAVGQYYWNETDDANHNIWTNTLWCDTTEAWNGSFLF